MASRAVSLFRIRTALLLGLYLCTAPRAIANQSNSKQRVQLIPQYSAGQVLRYSIQLRMKTTAQANGPIVDPEGATQFANSISVVLRLDVLSAAQGKDGTVRMRATYESVAASSKSNSYDPDAEALEKQYEKLQGRSIEFTVNPGGKITNVTGLEEIITDPARAAEVNQWLSQITLGASVPRKGIAIGEKWSSSQMVAGAPLDGVVWHSRSTYQSDEPCAVPGAKLDSNAGAPNPTPSSPVPQECAIIVTRVETSQSKGDDRTPDAYKKNGLRTAGEWKSTGETLTAISLRTGMVMSVTQSGTTHMDVTITAAATGNHVRYTGDTQSEAEITLLPEATTADASKARNASPNRLK